MPPSSASARRRSPATRSSTSCSTTEPLLGRLTERWGADVAPEGRVDRARVGEIVFADPEQLSWLESQVHPLVGERIGAFLVSLPAGTEVAVVEVPLLFESEMEGVFDTTVAVVTSDERAPRPRRRPAATPWSASATRASSSRPRRPSAPST